MPWSGGPWSNLHLVTDRDRRPWYDYCENRSGLYRLIALQPDGSLEPAPICRVCGKDDTGTIYIGAARSLRRRISDLVKQHYIERFASRNHTPLPAKLALAFPVARLAVRWLYSNKPDVFAAEQALLWAYLNEFGELPPLNSFGRKKTKAGDIGELAT